MSYSFVRYWLHQSPITYSEMSVGSLGLGRRIRARREQLGRSAAEIARLAGISRAYLSDLENTEGKSPSAIILYRLADALETTMPHLLGLPPQPRPIVERQAIPRSLMRAKQKYQLHDHDVALLAGINYAGQQPLHEDDWYFLLQALRLTLRPPQP